ncbi:hypothetical protein [uncultured Hymenobacter sp.]|uniref:hypothetical protein n=1 Tax=uncultured Hymenobacter sp. TaxID=170016 RepID=UPI0035CC346B
MEFIGFNLNQEIYVKLHAEGYEIWKAHEDLNTETIRTGYPDYMPVLQTLEDFRGTADANGYVPFMGWKFISIFGPHTRLGSMHYSANIKLKSNTLLPIACE